MSFLLMLKMKKILFVFVLLTFFGIANAQETKQNATKPPIYLETNFGHAYYSRYVFLLGFLIFVLVIRHFMKVSEFTVPHSVFSIFIGILWGVLAFKFEVMKATIQISNLIVINARDLYLPIILFGTSFCIDAHAFIKSLPQILIISIPLFLVNGILCGIFMGFVIDLKWATIDGIFLGMIMNTAYPLEVIHWLKGTNQTKHVIVLLEGEVIIGITISVFVYNCIKYTIQGWIVYWYQYAMGVVRLLLLNIPASYLLGYVFSLMLRINYQDTLSLAVVTFIACFTSYYFISALTAVGATGCLITGVIMGLEKTTLPSEMERAVTDLWKVIVTLFNNMVYLMIGAMTPHIIMRHFSIDVYALALVNYLIANIGRFVCFFIFSPILSRIGYGMTFKHMILLVWVGLKNPVGLSMVANVYMVYIKDTRKFHLFYFHGLCVYLLYLFFNASFLPIILKTLGLTELSISKQLNMNICVRYVLQSRDRTIAILKMDRFLSDANWPLVMSMTAFKHPYRKRATNLINEQDSGDEEDPFLSNRFSTCPDCKSQVPNEPTQRELKDMTKEAKMRLLKLRKIFYSRRYESGMMTKDGARIAHQSIEVALDSEQKIIEIKGLVNMFFKENKFYKFIQKRFNAFLRLSENDLKPPKKHLRIICHHLKSHIGFEIFMYCLYLVNLADAIYYLIFHDRADFVSNIVVVTLNTVILICFIVTSAIIILGNSQEYIWKDGVRKYFRSVWNILHFIMICDLVLETVRRVVAIFISPDGGSHSHSYFHKENCPAFIDAIILHVLIIIRLFGILYFLYLIKYYKKLIMRIVTFLDMRIDKYKVTAFELAKNFICGEEELTENINNVVDNTKIRKAIKEKIDEDLLEVSRQFGMVQKQRPRMAVAVKTKLAITTILKAIKDDIQELKMSGWVDDIEYSKLNKSLAERYRFVRTIQTVQQPSPVVIFKEVSWMGTENAVINFLYSKAATRKFDPGDVVVKEGELIEGILIVVSGLLIASYTPQKVITDKLNEFGILPVCDYMSSTNFYDKKDECIMAGNTIGELCILTERPYNCTITAAAHSQVFVLPRNIMKQAMELDVDPINGLESRLWKKVAFYVSLPLLIHAPPYHSYTYENIKYVIDRSFVPNTTNYKVFIVNEMMEDIILVEGLAVDLHTRDMFTGPCYIQRSVQKLILPKSSAVNIDINVETILMVVPAKDFDEYELMLTEEKECELVSYSSSRCLQHLIQDRNVNKQYKLKKKATIKANESTGSKQSKSKITFSHSSVVK